MSNLSLAARQLLAQQFCVGRSLPVAEAVSEDGTKKYLFTVNGTNTGGVHVEAVYIPADARATLCVSTQAGCRMGCRFCLTGTLGFKGNLTAADILNQILYFPDLTNIVVMGEGEPMDNVEPVLRVIEILTASYGLAWSPSRVTVSTVGAGEGLERFLKESECNLAISLHNPFADERASIMPAERLRPLRDVLQTVSRYDFRHQRRLSFEYIVWGGLNDTMRHAGELLRLLRPFAPQCRLNLIRFHEGVSVPFPATDEQAMLRLQEYMNNNGITTTIRRSRGEDILAACGMLVNSLEN